MPYRTVLQIYIYEGYFIYNFNPLYNEIQVNLATTEQDQQYQPTNTPVHINNEVRFIVYYVGYFIFLFLYIVPSERPLTNPTPWRTLRVGKLAELMRSPI